MASIRNLKPCMVNFDLPALGTDPHHGGTNSLDPLTGVRGHRPHVKHLSRSVTLAACSNPRLSLDRAVREGSALDDLPDEVCDDPAVTSRVAKREMSCVRSPAQRPELPTVPDPLPTHDEVPS